MGELVPERGGPSHAEIGMRALLATRGLGSAALEIRDGYERRRYERAGGALQEIVDRVDKETIERTLRESDQIESIFWRAMQAAADSTHDGKRRLLGRAIASAMRDEAKIDEATLTVRVLEQIEPPDIKALERIYQAELAARDADEVLPRAPRAEREHHPGIREAAEDCHPQSIATLSRLGLVENAVGFGGVNVSVVGVTPFGERLLNELREPE